MLHEILSIAVFPLINSKIKEEKLKIPWKIENGFGAVTKFALSHSY